MFLDELARADAVKMAESREVSLESEDCLVSLRLLPVITFTVYWPPKRQT